MDWQELALAQLARWGLSEAEAVAAGIRAIDDASAAHRSFKREPGLILPYLAPDGSPLLMHDGAPFMRVRYLAPAAPVANFLGPQKPQRYSQPPDSGCFAYFPPGIDLSGAITITEGEAKAIAATLAGIPTIGLGGVANIHNLDGKFLPELVAIGLERSVTICFDSDAATNPQIQTAEARLVEALFAEGSSVRLARLPGNPDGSKVGMDDYLLTEGAAALKQRLSEAIQLGEVEAAIVGLNQHVAWIESEGMLFNLATNSWVRKDAFMNGADFSALFVPAAPSGKGKGKDMLGERKKIHIAPLWLKSGFARRYKSALFRPGEGPEVLDDGAPSLNIWTGLQSVPGNAQPFLELSEFLFSEVPAEHRELPLRWLAYKAQNPSIKIPLALVLIGNEGVGKSFWTKIVRDAFAPYGYEMASAQLRSEFQGWLERSLVAVINEAEGEDVTRSADVLKSLISEETRPMNEKFRIARQVRTYTSYILTSNRRSVGAYSADNRRMFVVNCPAKPREKEFYEALDAWSKEPDYGRHVMHWLLSVDLAGWVPPQRAPVTTEKLVAYSEMLSPIQDLANDCLTNEGGIHIIKLFLDRAHEQSQLMTSTGGGPQLAAAARTLQALETMQLRPWYTAKELALIFPDIAIMLYGARKLYSTPAGEISRQLRDSGIPYLTNADDPRGFMFHGKREQFLVLTDFDDWQAPITQAQFEAAIKNYPRYSDGRR